MPAIKKVKNFSRKDIELLAPAGDYESLMAAIQGGADAVYFGVKQLNMRARSSHNFSLGDLEKVVRVLHKHNKKAYLTVNTILYDKELPVMQKIVDRAQVTGVDALIISDQAALQYARQKKMEVHLSTQVNISNSASLKFYSGYADVVVLARELTLKQVKNMIAVIRNEDIRGPSGELIRIELFAHGALCMAISGKCYLSLHEQNASANRGTCLQTCRKAYVVTDKETGYELEIDNEYIMSPKDLATIDFLDLIVDAGVRILKIEGRARSPEYVYTTVLCYNEALKALEEGTYSQERIREWKERLSTVFNRGFWDGYYLGRKMGAWSDRYGTHATKKKIYTGKGTNYFSKLKIAEFIIEAGTLSPGDEVVITGPTTGVIQLTVEEIRVDDRKVESVSKGTRCSFAVERKVRRSDKLYRLVRGGKE
ncbi:MAG: U32 family peptidase [Bacteroidales bacterium]|nr:U32 family peptidase [Bacteroidales bacterium]